MEFLAQSVYFATDAVYFATDAVYFATESVYFATDAFNGGGGSFLMALEGGGGFLAVGAYFLAHFAEFFFGVVTEGGEFGAELVDGVIEVSSGDEGVVLALGGG